MTFGIGIPHAGGFRHGMLPSGGVVAAGSVAPRGCHGRGSSVDDEAVDVR